MGQQRIYQHWEGDADKGTVVLQEDLNEVHIPKRLKGAMGNHRYGKVIDPKNNQISNGYIAITYERSENEFPKLLYHPEYGQTPEPKVQHFAAGAHTAEASEAAHQRFNEAVSQWRRKNRTKLVQDAKEEKRLRDKGWALKMPTPPVPVESQDSDEI